MINLDVYEEKSIVYIEVSGYITSKDAFDFLSKHRDILKSIRSRRYNLVIKPSIFECEDESDIQRICTSLFKHGYKKMYLIDSNKYIVKKLRLSKFEEKIFNKYVRTIDGFENIK